PGVEFLVDAVRDSHDLAGGTTELPRVIAVGDDPSCAASLRYQLLEVAAVAQLTTKVLRDEISGAAGDVDVLADQIAVHTRDEIVAAEVQVLDVRIQLSRDVVPEPFRVHAHGQVPQRVDPGAAGFGHLLAVHGQVAVNVDVIRHFVGRAGELEHRRPEQRVEVDDVLADEMNLLSVGRSEEILEAAQLAARTRLAAVEVAFQ